MLGTILQLAGAFAIFVAFFALVCWGLARGGWGRLAEEYRARDQPDGKRFRCASGHVGKELIVGGLTVIVADEGVWLESAFLGAIPVPFHPPLLIPWSSISPDASGTSRHEFPLRIDTVRGPISLELDGRAGRAVRKLIESRNMA
jgi:hypothetical protein